MMDHQLITAPRRILHIVGGMNRGGVETWLMHLLRKVDRAAYRMDFLVHTDKACAYDEEILALGSKILRLPSTAHPHRYAPALRRLLAEGRYDVVHSHVYLFSGLTLLVARAAGIGRRVAHIYPHVDWKGQSLARRLYRAAGTTLISACATDVLFDSLMSLSSHVDTGEIRCPSKSVVYCGIDLAPFAAAPSREATRRRYGLPLDLPLVVYVARFAPHKNHRQLIRVAERINQGGRRAHFLMIGSHGELLSEMSALASGRSDLTVLTNVDEVAPLLLAADLFFFPSLNEGFGLVAVEACAAGLPVVATALPTIKETCPATYHQFMFAPDDDNGAAASIERLVAHPELRTELGAAGKRWARRFALERSLEQLLAFYGEERSR